jgi:hypothetical protein
MMAQFLIVKPIKHLNQQEAEKVFKDIRLTLQKRKEHSENEKRKENEAIEKKQRNDLNSQKLTNLETITRYIINLDSTIKSLRSNNRNSERLIKKNIGPAISNVETWIRENHENKNFKRLISLLNDLSYTFNTIIQQNNNAQDIISTINRFDELIKKIIEVIDELKKQNSIGGNKKTKKNKKIRKHKKTIKNKNKKNKISLKNNKHKKK